ncbi:MAG: alpha/beta family hydrolase [Gemmatimonadaceae bacterium]
MARSRIVRVVHRVWVTVGLTAFVVFAGWSLLAYRANGEAHRAVESSPSLSISHEAGYWSFTPLGTTKRSDVGLLFFAGSLVDPVAYAPIARAAASAGFPALVVELPRRGAFGGADDPALLDRARSLMRRSGGPSRWVVAGHSRGGAVASQLASEPSPGLVALVLIGTSHPRDFSLAHLTIPVTKISGSRDGLARPDRIAANRSLLPATTRWVEIAGGNHSQFGWYGFQPGDRRATIPAAEQRAVMLRAIGDALHAVRGRTRLTINR